MYTHSSTRDVTTAYGVPYDSDMGQAAVESRRETSARINRSHFNLAKGVDIPERIRKGFGREVTLHYPGHRIYLRSPEYFALVFNGPYAHLRVARFAVNPPSTFGTLEQTWYAGFAGLEVRFACRDDVSPDTSPIARGASDQETGYLNPITMLDARDCSRFRSGVDEQLSVASDQSSRTPSIFGL
ncbi:hypothetical protein NMY22_g8405 [Coprinellus aureogranulatus]|nr:hypothetical protein NMY22_g8405 [Coprinellus aureogranulatus]